MNIFCRISAIAALILLPIGLSAQEAPQEDNTFGGWEFFEVYYDIGKTPLFASFYFEHDNFQYKRFDNWYTRTTFGVKILPWLSADVAYDFIQEPDCQVHRAIFDLTGSLKQGNLKVSIRERYLHNWVPAKGSQSDELRSRLKVQYAIPKTKFSPYIAIEVFTWGVTWRKTRHYVACNYDITSHVQFEAYYMYYAFNGAPAEHVIGLGLNFKI